MKPHGPRASASDCLMVGLSIPNASFLSPSASAKFLIQDYDAISAARLKRQVDNEKST